jgi:hypothetical protein
MPNREQRKSRNPALDKWLYVEDNDGNGYRISMRDISGKDEYEFSQMIQGNVGLCDLFFEGKPSLVNISGLIWAYRRKNGESKLTVAEVMKTVNLATIETLELHDPAEEDDEPESDDAQAKLAKIREEKSRAGFGESSAGSAPSSEPSTV